MIHHVVMREANKVCFMQCRELQREIKGGRWEEERQKVVELSSKEETTTELVKKSYWWSIS